MTTKKRPIIKSRFKKRILKELKSGPLDHHELAVAVFGKYYTSDDTKRLSDSCASLKKQGYIDNPRRKLISFGFKQANWGSIWELVE